MCSGREECATSGSLGLLRACTASSRPSAESACASGSLPRLRWPNDDRAQAMAEQQRGGRARAPRTALHSIPPFVNEHWEDAGPGEGVVSPPSNLTKSATIAQPTPRSFAQERWRSEDASSNGRHALRRQGMHTEEQARFDQRRPFLPKNGARTSFALFHEQPQPRGRSAIYGTGNALPLPVRPLSRHAQRPTRAWHSSDFPIRRRGSRWVPSAPAKTRDQKELES